MVDKSQLANQRESQELTDIRLVLFDLDGTLVDTAPDMIGTLNEMLDEHSLPLVPYEKARGYVSHGVVALLRLGFERRAPESRIVGDLFETFLERYACRIADQSSPFPGIEELLVVLNQRGIRWGVVTNKTESLASQLLRALKLTSMCGCIVGRDTLPVRKPDPQPLLHACKLFDVRPGNAVYIGDAEADVECARRASIRSIAVTYGYFAGDERPDSWGATELAHSPSVLLGILERWGLSP